MQLHAIDNNKQVISARRARKQINYICSECKQIVRLRSGPHRQAHFYHLEPTPLCRQHQKGPIHLQLQSYFFNNLPKGDCQLELPFTSVGRIADVAWMSQKIVFEIQYSAIKAEEVLARNHDYNQMGWKVIWILHDHRYNQVRLTAAEMALRLSPHFFSNMDHNGLGIIYDQFDIWDKGLRWGRLPPLPIDIMGGVKYHSIENQPFPLFILKDRSQNWPLSFTGDLMHLFKDSPNSEYLSHAIEKEKNFYSTPGFSSQLWIKFWHFGLAAPYQIFFRFILERMCR